jgi:hypothetical protein
MRFLIRIALSAAAFAIGAAALRRWLEEQNAATATEEAPPSAAGSNHTDPAYDSLTRDELYERAQVAGVKGRSKMNKTELAEAVAQAELGGG